MRRAAFVLVWVLAVTGCTTGAAPVSPAAPVAALRTDATEAGTSELAAAARRLVGATRITLAVDAFTAEPEIAVERRRDRGLEQGQDGFVLDAPIRLRLERAGDGCRLLRVGSTETVPLPAVRCAPIDG